MSWEKEVEAIRAKRALAKEMGGAVAVERQHERGRLTIRERIEALVDKGSFQEQGEAAGASELAPDGSVTGFTPANYVLGLGLVGGRRCVVGGEDFTLKGGSPNAAGLRKSVYSEDLAITYRLPLIRLHEGAGGSVGSTGGGLPVGEPVNTPPRFRSIAQVLNMVPVASAALGPVAGMPASRLVASHFCAMTRETSQVIIAGAALVERALGEKATKESLGSAPVHERSGVIDAVADDEEGVLELIRKFLSYLPSNVWELAPRQASGDDPSRADDELLDLVPRDRRKPYDVRQLIGHVVDRGSFFELLRRFATGLVTGLARLDGRVVGIYANDCRTYAGCLTADGSHKARRFVELCETFHIPVIALVDEPGFMIGEEAEKAATIRHGTSAVLTVAQANVPWASVVVRKSFGVASAAHYGNEAYVLAWPSAELGALPVEGGVAVAYGREIAAAADPEAKRRELEEELARRTVPQSRAEAFAFHELIDPRETRAKLCQWLDWCEPRLEGLKGPSAMGYRP